MSTYVERVTKNLEGLDAVSTGPCPGCEECADHFGFTDEYNDDGDTIKTAVVCFDEAYERGEVESEGSFSWSGCGICDSTLGGNLEVWHGVSKETGGVLHFDDACVDCVVYLANGDVPEEPEGENEENEEED